MTTAYAIFQLLALPLTLLVGTVRGFYCFHFRPRKTIVIIACAMRTGSTLLKALLAEAPDVSNLSEIRFHRYLVNRYFFYDKTSRLSPKRIIVLKRPYWFDEVFPYPPLPRMKVKVIILIRNVRDTVLSLKVMQSERMKTVQKGKHRTIEDLTDYWCSAYEKTLRNKRLFKNDVCFLNYEDLVAEPVAVTKGLFRFIGSGSRQGVDTYHKPEDYEWRWGFDDNSERIRSLKVHKLIRETASEDQELDELIRRSKRVQNLNDSFRQYEHLVIRRS